MTVFERHKQQTAAREHKRAVEAELQARAARLPDPDGGVSLEKFHAFFQFMIDNEIPLAAYPDIRRVVMLGLAQSGYFLRFPATLLLKRGESAVYETHVSLLKEVTDRQFRGGSQGVSIPIGGGVRYRVGAYRGHMVTVGTHWETADDGQLTITDQRVLFHGRRKTLEFLYSKLVTLDAYTDGITLGVTNRQAASTFRGDDGTLLAGLIHAVLDHQEQGVKLINVGGATP